MKNVFLIHTPDKDIEMKAYMGYDAGLGAVEGAVLIFASTQRQAKRVGGPEVQSLFGSEFIDVRVRQMKDADHLFAEADQEKLLQGIAHVIDNPRTCVQCECWGYPFDKEGVCEHCREAEREQSV